MQGLLEGGERGVSGAYGGERRRAVDARLQAVGTVALIVAGAVRVASAA